MQKKYLKLDRKKGLYLKDTGAKGRGVFCETDIAPGAVLEIAPALILNEKDTDRVDQTILERYTFATEGLSEKIRRRKNIRNHRNTSCVIMGITSYCNHSESPNAEVLWEERMGTLYHTLRATRRIPGHTEICTSYGEGWFDDRKHDKKVK